MVNTSRDPALVCRKYGNDPLRLMDILSDVQKACGCVSDEAVAQLSSILRISQVDVEQTASFYHFFSRKPRGAYTVYLDNSAVANMMGRAAVAAAFEREAGCAFGTVSGDGLIGLFDTADTGMGDQAPAAIINDVVFTALTTSRVKSLVAGMRAGKPAQDLVEHYGDGANASHLIRSMVRNHIRASGDVILADFESGSAIAPSLAMQPDDVIRIIKESNLRGRGGAGFPTGMKWEFCRKASGARHVVICNADEGEPGTFKDRVILTERFPLVLEGMVVAGYAVGANEGIIYLRGEYRYLQRHLEAVMADYRAKHFLGSRVGGKDFSFDVRIQFGAGAYICGEESALIESAEGKRGEPRTRPPFPVAKGYMDQPTLVNNVETLASAARIMVEGARWHAAMGTDQSSGTKLLSVSGDCDKRGVYEVVWGITVEQLLAQCGGHGAKAVWVGGPSGTCIGPSGFSRKICFGDLSTGGSIIVVGAHRDLLDIVANFVEFFADESCGACVPCRAGNVIIRKLLRKIRAGHGVEADLRELEHLAGVMKAASRCGLGQTAANPVLTTIGNLKGEYARFVKAGADFDTTFDLAASVAESCAAVGRVPNLQRNN